MPDLRYKPVLVFAAAALVTALVYLPGLSGGFVLDDFPFLVQNADVHVHSFRFHEWLTATFSFPEHHTGRWLGMLSLAANHYLTGLDPFWFKATNVAIHVANGGLLMLALIALIRLWRHEYAPDDAAVRRAQLAIPFIVAAWLLLPINLTAVLYVIQRLESLAHTFVIAGLWLYLRARIKLAQQGKGAPILWAILLGFTAGGMLVKESAVLLPLYAVCVEAIFLFGKPASKLRRQIVALYACVLAVPLIAGLFWLASWIGSENTFPRDWSLGQRLLSQPRVLVHYIGWTLVPGPGSLSLFHDDFQVSTSVLSPWTTIPAMLALAALLAASLTQWRQRPLLCLGVLWFFAGHSLTATIIPLELVFEHRNYFASCGLLLAVSSLLWIDAKQPMRPRLAASAAAVLLCFYAIVTLARSHEWGSPMRFAISEAVRHPHSPRAQMEFARNLDLLAGNDPASPLHARTEAVLEGCMAIPGRSINCETSLILLRARLGRPGVPEAWRSLIDKLERHPPMSSSAGALAKLAECEASSSCDNASRPLRDAMQAAASHRVLYPYMLYVYSRYASTQPDLQDEALAMARRLYKVRPESATAFINLTRILLDQGRLDDADAELRAFEARDQLGRHAGVVESTREAIETHRQLRETPGAATG